MTLLAGSLNAKQQINARDKSQAVLMLITLSPPGFPIVRITDNLTDITSNGNVFTAFNVLIDLSSDDGKTLQIVKLSISNVTLEMIEWVRAVTDPIPVTIQTIFSSSPHLIEQQLSDLVIRNIKYDANILEGTLLADDDLNQLVPSDTYNSNHFPGLY